MATASASVGPGQLWGQPITVMNQQSDQSLFLTSSSSSSSTSTPTPSPSRSATTAPPSTGVSSSPESTSTVTTQAASSGLSTGADVGIGVGVGLGVLVLLAVAGFCWLRKRKARRPQQPELDGRQLPPMSNAGHPITNAAPHELEARRVAQELEGSYAPTKSSRNTEQATAYNQARAKRWRPRSTASPSELPA